MLAASFTPITAEFQLNVWNLLTLIGALLALWASLRRKPAVDVDLVQLKGSIEGLQKSVDALTAGQRSHDSHQSEIATLKAEVRELKGHREVDGGAQRRHIGYLQKEIFDKIESQGGIMQDKIDTLSAQTQQRILDLSTQFTANLQSIERGIGRFDASIDFIRDRLNGAKSS